MALQVWLPLNGDLHNQGLSNVTTINNGTTINNNGKIGKCYSFDGSSYIDTGYVESFGTGDFTICCWIYLTQVSGKTYQCIIGNKGTGAASVGISLYYNQNQKKFLWSTADGTNATEIWSVDTFDTVIFNKWHHIAMIRNNNDTKKGYFYFDGIRKEIASIPAIRNVNSTISLKIGSVTPTYAAYYYTGQINDVRIYNHALSDKEIKEISKGLVLHYPLNHGNKNLLSNYVTPGQNAPGSITTAGRTNYYGNYGIIIPATENADTYFRLFLKQQLTQGKTYTISCYVSGLLSGTYYNFPLFAQGNTSMGILRLDHNGLCSLTFTMNSSSQSTTTTPEGTTVYICFMDDSARTLASGQGAIIVNGFKLEEGDSCTNYNSFENNLIYDCSGYCHNGELLNSPTFISDTARFANCLHMSATNQKVKISGLTTTGFGNSYSFAWWEKISSTDPMHWGFADGIRLNGMYTGHLWNTGDGSNNPLYNPGTTTQVTNPTVNAWHHWVMTGDGTTCKVYQDGEFWGQAKTYKAISGTTIYINGWDSGTSYCSNNASMSDFRIYATALSAEDILDLYKTSKIINGTNKIPRDLE